jgi:hypothetical protein
VCAQEASPDHGQSLSPFGAACVGGHLAITRYLLEERGVDVGKWREAAIYGRLPLVVARFLLDWLPLQVCTPSQHTSKPTMPWPEM